jgi:uncharacterized cupredoxin-like copper-binding protein
LTKKEDRAMSKYRLGACVAIAITALATAFALPALAAQSAMSVKVVAGKPAEFRFTVTPKAGRKGVVSFTVVNRGALPHTFKIKGKVTRLLTAGKSEKISVVFTKAGRYPFVCTVAGHAAAGMKGVFTVS